MSRSLIKVRNLLALTALSAAVAFGACSKSSEPTDHGSLNVALAVPGGYTVNSVSYTVNATGGAVITTGTVDVSAAGSSLSFFLELPPGTGDTITLTATSTSGVTFTGTSTPFNVVSSQTTLVSVTLTNTLGGAAGASGSISVTGTIVPASRVSITSLSVSPLQVAIGTPVSLTVAATDANAVDTLTYAWTATPDGAFAAPSASSTTYTGSTVGTKTLTITVTDNQGATTNTSVQVTVISTGAGGTTGAAGAPATGGTTGTGGAPATGGATGTGGTPATGGTTGTGGTPATGGTTGAAGAPATGGTTGTGGSPATGGTTGSAGVSGAAALEAAELATTTGIGVDNYDPTLLTYTSGFDADGNPIAIGWGPTTLPSAAQQQASAALIRAIAAGLPGSVRNSQDTANATPGTPSAPSSDVPNPPNGLLTLGTTPASLLSGTGIGTDAATQALLTAYANAAIADSAESASDGVDPGGLTAAQAASNATLGAYIASNAVNPSSAIGIAVNIVTDAVQYGLEAQLKAF
jgi:collagen type VII alpha